MEVVGWMRSRNLWSMLLLILSFGYAFSGLHLALMPLIQGSAKKIVSIYIIVDLLLLLNKFEFMSMSSIYICIVKSTGRCKNAFSVTNHYASNGIS